MSSAGYYQLDAIYLNPDKNNNTFKFYQNATGVSSSDESWWRFLGFTLRHESLHKYYKDHIRNLGLSFSRVDEESEIHYLTEWFAIRMGWPETMPHFRTNVGGDVTPNVNGIYSHVKRHYSQNSPSGGVRRGFPSGLTKLTGWSCGRLNK